MTKFLPNLALDVGGTNVRLVAFDQVLDMDASVTYAWGTVSSLPDAIARYSAEMGTPAHYGRLVLAFAGPTLPHQEVFSFTNQDQTFTRAELQQFAGEVEVINDFAAQAALIPHLGAGDLQVLKPGEAQVAARAVIGPGTGLGVAAILADGTLVQGEGGNVTLPYLPSAPLAQMQVDGQLRLEDGLSGHGLERLYLALGGAQKTAKAISEAAHAGDALALEAFGHFFDFLALGAANQALQYMAAGGVYIVGNVINANIALLDQARFDRVFTSIITHAAFLKSVPVYLVTREGSGLQGAAAYLQSKL